MLLAAVAVRVLVPSWLAASATISRLLRHHSLACSVARTRLAVLHLWSAIVVEIQEGVAVLTLCIYMLDPQDSLLELAVVIAKGPGLMSTWRFSV